MAFSPFFEELREAEPLYKIGRYDIVRCRDSQLVYLSNPLDDEELERFYSVEYFEGAPDRRGYFSYQADEDVLRRNFRDLRDRVLAQVPNARQSALMDYGCAYGYFLDEARGYFREVRGVELSESVAAIGRTRFGLRIASARSGEDAPKPSSLDVVTLWDVIEHLPRPRTTLSELARVLRPGGRLFLTTGDVSSALSRAFGRRWRLMNPPQHITYFSEQTLRRLLEACGFRVDGTARCGKYVSLGFFHFILRYLLGLGVRPARASSLAARCVYLNLFDVMFMSATRI